MLKKVRKIILGIFGLAMFIELIGIPFLLVLNHNYPGLINIKTYLLRDSFAIVLTYAIGLTFYELTHSKKEKHENKNR